MIIGTGTVTDKHAFVYNLFHSMIKVQYPPGQERENSYITNAACREIHWKYVLTSIVLWVFPIDDSTTNNNQTDNNI